jgi:hypothetical protein
VKAGTVRFAFVLALPLLAACPGHHSALWHQELPGGYELLAIDTPEQMELVTPRADGFGVTTEVEACVYAAAHDHEHILIARHPTFEPQAGHEGHAGAVDFLRKEYWIFVVGAERGGWRVHGPLGIADFERTRRELGVDPELELESILGLE